MQICVIQKYDPKINTLLQAQLSHGICSFEGRGMILIFTGIFVFALQKEK